eukprot:6476342-Amphidinium_carterae.1
MANLFGSLSRTNVDGGIHGSASAIASMSGTDNIACQDEDSNDVNMRADGKDMAAILLQTRSWLLDKVDQVFNLLGGQRVWIDGLPIYNFCGVIVPSRQYIDAVVDIRAKPEPEGWGVPAPIMRRRIELDMQSRIGQQCKMCIPSSLVKQQNGKYLARVTVMGQESKTEELEANQLVPAMGIRFVNLKYFPEMNSAYESQHQYLEEVSLATILRSGCFTQVTGQRAKKFSSARLITVDSAKAGKIGIVKQRVGIIELPPILFPMARMDLAREQS